jgi:hypothetical protein
MPCGTDASEKPILPVIVVKVVVELLVFEVIAEALVSVVRRLVVAKCLFFKDSRFLRSEGRKLEREEEKRERGWNYLCAASLVFYFTSA